MVAGLATENGSAPAIIAVVRIVVTTQPSYGHLHPLAPLCRALVDAGHEVAVATAASFRRLSEHAQTLGLAGDLWGWLGGSLYLDACPPVLQSPGATFRPRRRQLLRPEVFDATDGVIDPPGWLAARRDRPLVYVGLGTVMNRWHGLLHRLVSDLACLDLEVAVTTGPGLDPAELGTQPANVHVQRYVPLTSLLPHCDAVVCHAGWGTTLAALARGLPIVAIPLGADGPRTAARYQEAGIGRVVEVDDVGRGAIADAVSDVIANPRFSHAAQAGKLQIDQMPAPFEAVKTIASLRNGSVSGP